MAGIKLLLTSLVLIVLLTACSGEVPGYVDQAFPTASSVKLVKGERPQGVQEVWRATDQEGKILGYSALAEAQGYHGPIQVAVSWIPGQGISSVQVVQEDESPDYGGVHLHSPWFLDQYLGNPQLESYNLVKLERNAENDIAIITGATMSSQAATLAVNSCIEVFQALE